MLPYLVSNKRIIHKLIGFRVQGLIQSRDLWRHSCHTWTTSNVVDAEVLPWNRSVLDDKQKYFCFRWVVTSGVKYQLIGPLTLGDCCKSLRILKQIGKFCIFGPAFGCCALQKPVEIVIFNIFAAKNLKKQEICSKF